MSLSALWMLARDRVFITALGAGTAFLALTGWFLFGSAKPAPKAGPRYTHLHCPICQAELSYSVAMEGKPCPECDSESGLVPTRGSLRDGGQSGRIGWAKVFAVLVVGSAVVPGLGVLAVVRLRALRRRADEERNQPLVVNCPFCPRKVSYPPSKVGEGHICSGCKTAFTLPGLERPLQK